MFQDSSEKAAQFLREAVPLMVKHQIPPTPYNYAIWYSYVSNRDPDLKAAIDGTIKNHGTCPSSATDELFKNHIIGDQLVDSDSAQENLKAIIAELRNQVDEALIGAEGFHQLLEESSNSLQQAPEKLDLGHLIETLAQGTQTVSDSSRIFRTQMEDAQREVEELKKELKRSQQEADRDPLTGLFNRRYFERQMKEMIVNGRGEEHSLIIVDIDHFKSFNDSYGHLIGDKVIQRVATLLEKAVIGEEMAVRFGGEEFMLLIRESNLDKALERAEKVRKMTQGIVLKDRKGGGDIRRITASFGVTRYRSGEALSHCIERADKALYQAKENGRNRVESGG
ncbi:MAG: GGDEF domain-containing protein [Motiliproteus sp.]|nr:GGDEF domain-containing protein [Motiliproteus sp.]MCW9053151.1 GGDEF domain-containing protein [Motiliproteus sp.]